MKAYLIKMERQDGDPFNPDCDWLVIPALPSVGSIIWRHYCDLVTKRIAFGTYEVARPDDAWMISENVRCSMFPDLPGGTDIAGNFYEVEMPHGRRSTIDFHWVDAAIWNDGSFGFVVKGKDVEWRMAGDSLSALNTAISCGLTVEPPVPPTVMQMQGDVMVVKVGTTEVVIRCDNRGVTVECDDTIRDGMIVATCFAAY